jgi:hypothetical protein
MTTTPDSERSLSNKISVTKTTESGAFIRTTYREGKKRRQETVRIEKNTKKVVLGHLGEFEVYVYPFDFPDKVFIGKFPVSTYITLSDVKGAMGIINISKWFLEGKAFDKPTWRKAANSRRRAIQTAYDQALNELTSKKKAPIENNSNITTREKNLCRKETTLKS